MPKKKHEPKQKRADVASAGGTVRSKATPATAGAADGAQPAGIGVESAQPNRRRVLIVDDHPIVRERLAELINREADLIACGEAEDGPGALAAIDSSNPNVAIVDISLKDTYGIELIKQIKQRRPELPVLVLSMHDESMYGERALRAGAMGYLNKQEATQKVIPALRQVLAGQVFVSPAMAAGLVQKVARGGAKAGVRQGGSATDVLTEREAEIFQFLGVGKSTRDIAAALQISVKTVEAHREHIKHKLNLKTSGELMRYAIEARLRDN
jgi:DNA-binding NarL/FixJ family response regulator